MLLKIITTYVSTLIRRFFPNVVVSFVDVYPSALSFASQNETDHPLPKLVLR